MGNNPIKNLVFVPPNPAGYNKEEPRKVEFIRTINSNVNIPMYYIPCNPKFLFQTDIFASKVNLKTIKTTILYSHGNATDIGQMNEFFTLLNENLPVNICAYDYIGYGLSHEPGKENKKIEPSEQNTYESIYATYSYLKNEKNVHRKDMILWGTSLGSGATLELASRGMEFGGIVLESPFLSCCRVVETVKKNKVIGAVLEKTLNVDMFTNLNKIGNVRSPILMFHGKKDKVVPFDHGRELWGKIEKKWKYKNVWIEEAGHHNIIPKYGIRKYVRRLNKFIEFIEEKNNVENEEKKTKDQFSVEVFDEREKKKKKKGEEVEGEEEEEEEEKRENE